MLNSISRLGETRPEQEWSNGTEFSGYSDFPEKRVHSKRIPKFSKTFPGIFTVPFNFEPEISEILAEWKAPQSSLDCEVRNYPQMTQPLLSYMQWRSYAPKYGIRPLNTTTVGDVVQTLCKQKETALLHM